MENERKKAIEDFFDTDRIWLFPALKSSGNKGESFTATLKFDNYMDLMFTIRDIMKVSLHTLYNDGAENSGEVDHPTRTLKKLLEIALQLMPIDEFEVLDSCHELYLKLEELKKE